jgi:RND family efflux transporter MFP subunit
MYLLLCSLCAYLFMTSSVSFSEDADTQEFDGLIEPYVIVNVGTPVAGVIDSVTVDRGDNVKEGEVLATLQSDVEKATMELARARAEMEATIKAKQEKLEYEKRREQRMRPLYSQKVLPFQEWDEVETRRSLAEQELAQALEDKRLSELEFRRAIEIVKRTTIRSPLTGVVVERYLYSGEYVEDKPIMKLAQINPLNVEVILPVEMLGSVRVGMRAKVKPETPINSVYRAKVKIVDRVVDAASGTFGVRLELPNPDYRLPPGLKCKVIFLRK